MKKFILISVLLIAVCAIAQPPISVYYPAPLYFEKPWVTPMGYVEFNHVSVKLQEFMPDRMEMGLDSDNFNLNDQGAGTITLNFIDQISVDTTPRRMAFTFNVFAIDSGLIIESVKITGDQNRLAWFFVQFWPTTLNLDDIGKKKIAHNYLYQDEASYYGNYIEVKNNTVHTKQEFLETYNKAVLDHQTAKVEATQKKELEAIKKAVEKETYENISLKVKKNRNGIDFDNVPQELHSYISEYLESKDNGDYALRIRTTIQNKTITKANVYTDKFEPTVANKLFNKLISN